MGNCNDRHFFRIGFANFMVLCLIGLLSLDNVSAFLNSFSCNSNHHPRDASNFKNMLRPRSTVFSWCHKVEAHAKAYLPWLRPIDKRSSKVKYLDTCLALVSEDSMAAWLERQANVDLSDWGKGKAKAVGDLLKEVMNGESELRSDGTRVVRVVKVRIVDNDFELINTLQVLSNGVVKERNRELSEKFRCDESPAQAAARGIREELGPALRNSASIRILPQRSGRAEAERWSWLPWLRKLNLAEVWEEEELSTSYPGLRCVYRLHRIHAQVEGLSVATTGASFITAEAADSDGHSDKLHVWEWRRRDESRDEAAAVVAAGQDAAAAAAAVAAVAATVVGEPVGQLIAPEVRVFSF